jgi:hypothetical protein
VDLIQESRGLLYFIDHHQPPVILIALAEQGRTGDILREDVRGVVPPFFLLDPLFSLFYTLLIPKEILRVPGKVWWIRLAEKPT